MEQVIKNRAILITGTVVPNSNFVTHTNIEKRLEEYEEGLIFYSNMFSSDDIYFLENSEYDFLLNDRFLKLFSDKKITLIKFPVSDKFDEGKGYQEFEMIDEAINKLSDKYSSFIKITGRYKVLNAKHLTNHHCKGLTIDCHKKPQVALTNFFYVRTDFYLSHFKSLYLKVNDAKELFIEKIIYEKIKRENLFDGLSLFNKNPIITGISGSYGGTLNRNKYKMILKNIERIVYRVLNIKQFLLEY